MQLGRLVSWIAGAIVGAALTVGQGAQAQDTHVWKIQSLWQAGSINQESPERSTTAGFISPARSTWAPMPGG